MDKSLMRWQILGFVFTAIAGVILHFLFDLTNQSVFVAPFSAVNESVWEHTKLLFFPMLLFAVIENRYIGEGYENFFCAKLVGILAGLTAIPVLYYTINGAFGNTPDFINIAIFFIATAISYILEAKLMKDESKNHCSPKVAVGGLIVIAVLFAVLTFFPLQIPLFEDPITHTYGYYGVNVF